MPGILIHVAVAVLCLVVVHLIHFKWEFSWSIFAGNFVPDALKFGLSAIKQGTLKIFRVNQDSFFDSVNYFSNNVKNWFSLGFFIFGFTFVLYHFHYIKKKKLEEYDELYLFFLTGIIIHLVLDILIKESGILF